MAKAKKAQAKQAGKFLSWFKKGEVWQFKRITLAVFVVVFALVGTVTLVGSRAYGCNWVWTNSYYPDYYYGSYDGINYSPTFTVPWWSACHDINVSNTHLNGNWGQICGSFRVRFYPSSGGSFTNSWKYVCSGSSGSLAVIAYGVVDGTRFRIETSGSGRAGDPSAYYWFYMVD